MVNTPFMARSEILLGRRENGALHPMHTSIRLAID
jgi:hypothetical protein